MDTRRIIIAVFVALLFSLGATYLVYRGIQSQRASQPQSQKVVAAAKAMEAGTSLSAENLTIVDWPLNIPITGAFNKVEDVAGKTLIYPLIENQPVFARYLAAAGSGVGLTTKIPEGMRAISVRSNEVTGVAGFLYPGSRVDVLVTYKGENMPNTSTHTILQDVEVLTAGQRIEPDPQGKPETVNVVTVLLNPQDSEKLALATQQGTIQFVLRNGADKTKVTTVPVQMSQMMSGEPIKKPVENRPASGGVRVNKPKPPNFYEVEVISGDKRTTEKFQTTPTEESKDQKQQGQTQPK
jgi:pilus assembly protein CpaB